MKVSIIIRTKNEEKWISHCFSAIFSQDFEDFEVILVDNLSTDKTVEKAKKWPIKLVELEDYLPGDAINKGILASNGEIICCLSGHCIPSNTNWLKNLISPLKEKEIAGVFGRQVPLSSSHDLDKRDLFVVFGKDKRIQEHDTYFHNANSAFSRKIWERFPFDAEVTNIEDRIWGEQVISSGLKIAYEPSAEVYHHHGINQEGDRKRATNVVRILEKTSLERHNLFKLKAKTNDVAIIYDNQPYNKFRLDLLSKTINNLKKENIFKHIVFSGSDKKALSFATKEGCVIHKRNSKKEDINTSIINVLDFYENEFEIPDSVTVTSVNYPYRSENSYLRLVESHYESAMLPTLFGWEEKRSCFAFGGENEIAINNQFELRKQVDSGVLICSMGFGCTSNPSSFRERKVLNQRINIIPLDKQKELIEVNEKEDLI